MQFCNMPANGDMLHDSTSKQRRFSADMNRKAQLLGQCCYRGVKRGRCSAFAERPGSKRRQPIRLPVLEHALVSDPLLPQIRRRNYPLLMNEAYDFL